MNLWIQTNTAATLKPVIMQGMAFSHMEWKSINFMKKLIQIQTDIIFLSKCKQMDIVPKGLKVMLLGSGEIEHDITEYRIVLQHVKGILVPDLKRNKDDNVNGYC
ncbi:hypothetical protein UY3_05756 [Chelonia mydas]|uniref:Uncharacterized protein n=1 Tax=Chelonia mydas TaxID=8469 RepID=M7C8Y2_CHEMY|nr:hypothetical protein UY3_05756 [Chelonia mydas]